MELVEKAKHLITGKSAEKAACQYLKKLNFKLIEKNYRCRFGEIDIIMLDKQSLVFIEVRFRKNKNYGSGAESVTIGKQKKLINTASHYLQNHPESARYSTRFDVISISEEPTLSCNKIEWIRNAFQT